MASQFPDKTPQPYAPPQSTDPNNKSSGASSGLKILLIILIVVLLVCAGICGGCVFVGRQAAVKIAEMATITQDIQNAASPATHALQNNEAIKEKFGDEVELSPPLPDIPKIKDFKDRSNVPFIVTVKGSKGEGIAHCRAAEQEGRWKVLEIKVTAPDGSTVDVPVTEEAPPELQFNVPGGDGENK